MANVQELLQKHLDNVKSKIAKAMAEQNRNASGRSVGSLSVQVNGNVGALYGSKSFLVMERGKKPGKIPFGFVGIIKQWIVDKGIAFAPIPSKTNKAKYSPEERGLNSLAGAIAYTIMRKGTRLFRDNGYNDIFTTAVKEELEALSNEVIILQSETIAEINKNAL